MPSYATTLRNKLRTLTGTNKVSDVDAGFAALGEDVDTKMASWWEDTFAKRPAAGQPNRFFRATDTGALYHDNGSTWEQLLRAGDQSFPQSFFTGLIVGAVVSGSERIVNLRKGALVEYKGLLRWLGSGDQGVVMNLWRDGVVVDEINMHGLPGGTTQAFLAYIETAGGTHSFVVEIGAYGTTQNFNLENGLITFGT